MMDSSLVLNQSQEEEAKDERIMSRNRSVDAAASSERRLSNKLDAENVGLQLLQMPTPSKALKQPQDASFEAYTSPIPTESATKRQIQTEIYQL